MVTAGPTYEAIDPVRFIGNWSSGKMGFSIAEAFAQMGAEVTLVTGPTNLKANHTNIKTQKVISAQEMYDACISLFPNMDIGVLSAAVADFKPAAVASQKIKKDNALELTLERTKDIAATLGKMKKANQHLIGFALETENEAANAAHKLKSKNFDLIVLNSLNDSGAGFGHDTNKVSILNGKSEVKEFSLKEKKEVAEDIVRTIIENFYA